MAKNPKTNEEEIGSPTKDADEQIESNADTVATPPAPKSKAKAKPIEVPEAEYDRRTKLDVSHKDYINPSLDHHTIKKAQTWLQHAILSRKP